MPMPLPEAVAAVGVPTLIIVGASTDERAAAPILTAAAPALQVWDLPETPAHPVTRTPSGRMEDSRHRLPRRVVTGPLTVGVRADPGADPPVTDGYASRPGSDRVHPEPRSGGPTGHERHPGHHAERRPDASRSSASASSRSRPRRPPTRCARRSRSATATSTPREMYGNEAGVGEAVRASGLDRDDVFVTSKLNNGFHRPDDARRAFDATLAELGFDYVDLFLIHWPLPTLYDGDFVSTWKTLEEFQRDGRARSIGVSNFQVAHLERLAAETDIGAGGQPDRGAPLLRQRRGPRLRPASTASRPRPGRRSRRAEVLDDPVITDIAEQRRPDARAGRPALARPARRHRLPEVGDAGADARELRDLRLRAGGTARSPLIALDRGEAGRTGPHPDTFDWVPD